MEKMKAYKLQENGVDTVEANILLGHQADERDYGAKRYARPHRKRLQGRFTERCD